jgi:ribokinase
MESAHTTAIRAAVVGHVEWVEFLRVERVPARGEIVHATDAWSEPAGGGGVAAVRLAALAGGATLFTALGADDVGRQAKAELERLGVRVEAAWRPEPQRRAVTFLDEAGERTITVVGRRHAPGLRDDLPWEELRAADAVYVTAGEPEAIRLARAARVLVATSRDLATLAQAGVELDALVGSGEDPAERYKAGDLDPPPRLVVTTAGGLGGWLQPGGPFRAAELPGPVEDSYGCGDAFAAGLAYGLGTGLPVDEAVALAAREGALALCRRGAHGPASAYH